MSKVCKKCGYERQPSDQAPDYECPRCGAVYAKVEAYLRAQEAAEKINGQPLAPEPRASAADARRKARSGRTRYEASSWVNTFNRFLKRLVSGDFGFAKTLLFAPLIWILSALISGAGLVLSSIADRGFEHQLFFVIPGSLFFLVFELLVLVGCIRAAVKYYAAKPSNFIVIFFSVLMVGMLLFPPYHAKEENGAISNLGHAPIFSPPIHGTVDLAILIIQWIVLLVVGAVWLKLSGSTEDNIFVTDASAGFNKEKILKISLLSIAPLMFVAYMLDRSYKASSSTAMQNHTAGGGWSTNVPIRHDPIVQPEPLPSYDSASGPAEAATIPPLRSEYGRVGHHVESDPMSLLSSPYGSPSGLVGKDGTLHDERGMPSGHFLNNGTILDGHGMPVGHINNDGTVLNARGMPVGHINADGTVLNMMGSPVGHLRR